MADTRLINEAKSLIRSVKEKILTGLERRCGRFFIATRD